MKLHKGAVIDRVYRQITGNVLGAGASADEIVQAISEFGVVFDSAAPASISGDVSRAATSGGPFENGHTFYFSPVDLGFPNVAQNYHLLVTFNVTVSRDSARTPNVFPPSLMLTATADGCAVGATVTENFAALAVGQSGTVGGEYAHRSYTFTMLLELEDCDAGGTNVTLTLDDIAAWRDWGIYVISIAANAMLVKEG